MNKKLSVLYFLFLVSTAYSQTCTLKVPVTADDKAALLKTVSSLFKINNHVNSLNSIEYMLATNDFYPAFSDMNKEELYDDVYLAKYEKLLNNDPDNPLYMEALAKYYNFHEQYLLSKGYREKAFKNLNFSYFKKDKDSAHYYSFRGIMRYNLGDKEGLSDLDKALTINPNDSIGMTTYAIVLLQLGDYNKLRQVMVNALNAKPKYRLLQYMMFCTSDVLIQLMKIDERIANDSTFGKTLTKKNYDQLFDFKAIDELGQKLSGTDDQLPFVKPMIEVLVLMSKVQFFGEREPNIVLLSYTPHDIAKLKSLSKWFKECLAKDKLNAFTVYKNLGYIYFMLSEYDKSIEFFKKAKQVFPVNYRGYYFNDDCIYTALIYLSTQKKDLKMVKLAIQEKIDAQPTGKENYMDYRTMAEILFTSDSLDKANDWAIKASSINPNDCRTYMLLAHIAYMQDSKFICSSNIKEAIKYIYEEAVFKDLILQIMIYNLIDNDLTTFCTAYTEIRKRLVDETCVECDRIKEKYIEIK